jgi:hypothetical protein
MRRSLRHACRAVLASCLCCLALSGCAVQQLHADQDRIRCALLDLYTNQIIDNLIRAHNGLPIIQLDYTNATAVVTVVDAESMSDSVAATATRVTTVSQSPTLTNTATNGTTSTMSATPSTVGTATATLTSVLASTWSAVTTHGVVNTFTGTSSHTNSNQVALTAIPVTTSNDVYDAYIYFLTLPGSLQESCSAPPPDQVVICKKMGKVYYWVPAEFRRQFFELSLATTAQRGRPVAVPQFFDVTIYGVVGPPMRQDERSQVWNFKIVFDPKVPNAPGTAYIDGIPIDFDRYKPDNAPPPSMTNILQLDVSFKPAEKDPTKPGPDTYPKVPFKATTPEGLAAVFQTQTPKASLSIKGYRPEGPTTNQLLERVNFNLQQVQFNQLLGKGP